MCGIVGVIAKHKQGFYRHHGDLFTNMLRMDSIRGEDSTGVFGVTQNGKLDYLKGDADGYKFTKCEDYERFESNIWRDYRIIIGHNRKATKGAITAANAHPFVQKHICLVHNGTIFNSKDLNTEVEVDSEAIAHALSEHDAPAALQKLNGPYALVWYDSKDKTLSLARNAQRTLHVVSYPDCWVISSEIGLPYWLQARENRKSEGSQLLPTDKIVVFNLNNLGAEPKQIDYEAFKHYTPPAVEHFPHQSYAPVVRQFPRQHNLPSILQNEKIRTLKAGDVIKFKVANYDEHDPNDRSLLGNPIFDNEIDGNITVQSVLPKGEPVHAYLAQGEIFTATIMNIRPMGGKQVIFTHSPVVCRVVRDMHGVENEVHEVIETLKSGCSRCFKDMYVRDVGQSVVEKKKDGTWRRLCFNCVHSSIEQAKKENSLILPAANSVQ